MALKMFISAKRFYRLCWLIGLTVSLCTAMVFAMKQYGEADFGSAFSVKAEGADRQLQDLQESFALCAQHTNTSPQFLQSLVFPEIMRYQQWKDDVETESLRTLYVQLGEAYADFSIGPFQMKPSFAKAVEEKAVALLSPALLRELELQYTTADPVMIRMQRVERLSDAAWQMVYLTAFVSICHRLYGHKKFASEEERLSWYATVYNAGFQQSDAMIAEKIKAHHFYLQQGMPGKKFRYAAVARWCYQRLLAKQNERTIARTAAVQY
jgi:hypothetical protein